MAKTLLNADGVSVIQRTFGDKTDPSRDRPEECASVKNQKRETEDKEDKDTRTCVKIRNHETIYPIFI